MLRESETEQKPYLLFATPRTGSWAIYIVVSHYLKQMGCSQTRDLGEVFNLTSHSLWQDQGNVVIREYTHPVTTVERTKTNISAGARSILLEVTKKRGQFIKPVAERYFFKVFPFDLYDEDTTRWLMSSYHWIFLERRNIWEQLLSFLIANHTDCWEEKSRASLPSQIPSNRNHFEQFKSMIWRYHELKTAMKPKYHFIYEDFCSQPTQDFLLKAGFKKVPPIFDHLKVTEKQKYRASKELAFHDVETIKKWYIESFLNRLYPIVSIERPFVSAKHL